MNTFPHHQQNGCWVSRPLTTKPRIDRITTPNARTRYKGEGIGLGAVVTGSGKAQPWHSQQHRVTGQVWAQAAPYSTGNRGYWWVVDAEGQAWIMHDSSMHLEDQCGSLQGDLFEESA